MKILNKLVIAATLLLAINACKDGYIDDIAHVQAGDDESAPAITFAYPLQGTLIRVTEDVVPINIRFSVTDDIEIGNIAVALNGNPIAEFSDFLDYRRANVSFNYDNITNGAHTLTVTATDLSGKSTTQSVDFEKLEPYQPVYDGEIFYLPFDGENLELVTITDGTRVGNPGFTSTGKVGSAYAGATDAYLTFPTTGLTNTEFSAVMWYKLNAAPDRAGILVMGPPGVNTRTNGFRFFREGSATNQTFKLNVGTGSGESWFDGGATASVNPATTTDWIHLAFTISGTQCTVYINGEIVSQNDFSGIDWTGCDLLSVGSGAPRFSEWNHLSDLSHLDELRIFNKELSQTEIRAIIDDVN